MKRGLIFFLAAGFLLAQTVVYAQSAKTAARVPPVSQSLVREGDLAVALTEYLEMGAAKSEEEAETMLRAFGVTPRNGWIADYPVTPDIVGELEKAVTEAAAGGRLGMEKNEALRAFRTATVEAGIPVIAEISDAYPDTEPQYAESSVVEDYYSSEGPPVVTYYPPPPDYVYLYAWVPCPFYSGPSFFPGFYILRDFDKTVMINKRVVVVTNHVTDPKTRRVALIDPARRGTGKDYLTTVDRSRMGRLPSTDTRKGAPPAFDRGQQRTESTRSPAQKGDERGAVSPGGRGAPSARSFQGNGKSFNPSPSLGGRGPFGGFRGGGFSSHGGAGRCVGRC